MVFQSNYEFADLDNTDVKHLDELEKQLTARKGEEVTVIAYTRARTNPGEESCRPGVDE
ncbi:hypothetical protein [Paenibacillus turpanensis]|uniref:hypothetical protein n=1 Tax=Paenibacillus turpanensis TaxID=2689078 RepID=UPI00140753C2|nr:hypothetical protein [Paenibacillus turpanensis]